MKKLSYIQIALGSISLILVGLGFLAPHSNQTAVAAGMLAVIALVIIDIYTPEIAGLSADNPKVKTMRRLNYFTMGLIVVCFSMVHWLPELGSKFSDYENVMRTAFVIVLMAVIGNVAPKIPFNRYMGLRLPWTVRDESTWRVAHNLLGYITFPLLIVIILGSIFGNPTTFIKYSVIAWVAIPGVYSLWHYCMKVTGKR